MPPQVLLTRTHLPSLCTLLAIFCVMVPGTPATAQDSENDFVVKGIVKNAHNEVLAGATVGIPAVDKYTTTNAGGEFAIGGLRADTYQVVVTYVGHETLTHTVVLKNQRAASLDLTLRENTSELSEVVVTGKSDAQIAREQPIRAAVIDTRAVALQPASVVDLMNRSGGIRIRQTGGLGSSASIMLNGFQDRGIRYFKDNIPMDYLGAGYNFALVPVNMLDRIEVYKGVLPAYLGADALGGGVNMVSKKSYSKYVETSYEIASFNTHRASLNVYFRDTVRHYFAGADVFYNHSDNNYNVLAPVTDPDLGTQREEKVKLFHNKFTHYYTEVYGGVVSTCWADELRIGVTGFWIDRQNQYGSRMLQPFGASTSRQYSLIPTLRYQKTLLHDKLSIDQFLEANTITVQQVDTAKGSYNWYGEFKPSQSQRGEVTMRGSRSDVRFSYVTSRTYLNYALTPVHKLEFNVAYMTFERKGTDPLGLTFIGSGQDVLSVPANYDKTVAALGLVSRLMDERLTNNLIGKYYHAEIRATDGDYYGNEQKRHIATGRWGFADAVKFDLDDYSFLRFSTELATRLPEHDEVFGDGNLHVSNFELKPERSTNFNLGYRLSKHGYTLEVNSFYRITHDLILNVPYNFVFNRHENVDNVKGTGFEADATVTLTSWLKANGNFTYQDMRLFNTGNSAKEGARLRNTPYFFANFGLTAAKRQLFHKRDNFQAYWYLSFVREYYLDYIPKDREPDGFLGLWGQAKFDAPNIIPNQTINTAGVTYFPFDTRLSVGVQVRNLFDTNVYDNFRIQNAGRSFHLKLTYILQ